MSQRPSTGATSSTWPRSSTRSADAELGGASPKLVFESLVAERRAAGQLEPRVTVGERVGEGLEQQQLTLPGIDAGEHSDPQRSARLLGAWA